MLKINSNLFNQISFFLGGKKQVENLNIGAEKYGGATKFYDKIYSNFKTDENIIINEKNNTIALLIPSTLHTDKKINNKKYVKKYFNIIKTKYSINDLIFYNSCGSWYSDELKKVIIENNTIITLNIEKINNDDINFFLNLGILLKNDMRQECVSIIINDALCLV